MKATSTHRVTEKSARLLRQPIAALDAGNRTTQWITSEQVMTIPSVIKDLAPLEEAEFDSKSVLVEVRDSYGNTTSRFVIGAEAQAQKGTPVFEVNKVELAKHLIYAALEPSFNQSTMVIDCLRIALPDTDTRNIQNVAFLKELEGVYKFLRNGKHVVASIRHIEPVEKTLPAYRYAREHKLFKSPKSLNGILDLGSTGIGRLYFPCGSLNRQADVIVPATYVLAEKVNAALLPITGFSQDLSLIMDAIENGTFTISTNGISFAHLFHKCCSAWLEEILSKLSTKWEQYFSEIGEVLVIGGSAPLASPIEETTNGRFKVAPNPQTINIKGMML